MLGRCDRVDDDQLSAATRAWQREGAWRLIGIVGAGVIDVLRIGRFCPKQLPDSGDIGRAIAVAVKAIVTDAVLASWQNVDQEPSDELTCGQGHGGLAARAFKAIVFDAEGDTVRIKTDQAAVGNGDPVRVSRQIRQHGFGTGEGFFGVDDPVDFAERLQEGIEGISIGEVSVIAEEL